MSSNCQCNDSALNFAIFLLIIFRNFFIAITTYEIPQGHASYGPPSKAPTYSSATHQYLPPAPVSYSGGSAPFSSGHAAFEAPANNYLPAYGGQEGE